MCGAGLGGGDGVVAGSCSWSSGFLFHSLAVALTEPGGG